MKKRMWSEYVYSYLTKYGWELRSAQPRRWWRKDEGERSEEGALMMQRNLNSEARLHRNAA